MKKALTKREGGEQNFSAFGIVTILVMESLPLQTETLIKG